MTPNELDLFFWVADYGEKFNQNRARVATVYRRVDRQTDRQTTRSKNITYFGGDNKL